MANLNTRQYVFSILISAVLLIISWLSLVCIKGASRISFRVSGLSEPLLAGINPQSIKHSTVMANAFLGNDHSQMIPVSNSPFDLLKKSFGYSGINISVSKNSVAKTIGSSGKIQFRIMLLDISTLTVNCLGFGKIAPPFLPDIDVSFNGETRFDLNPFKSGNLNNKIYGLGNIDIEGNLLAVTLDISEGIQNRIRGKGKVSAFIKPEIYEKFLSARCGLKNE